MTTNNETFFSVGNEFGAGFPEPDHWRRLPACECLILVGLTGVGKSTVLALLTVELPTATLLPGRRELTDLLMIPFVQKQNGLPYVPVTDRAERFSATREYREHFPGGMAHALSTISVSPSVSSNILIFDGLRGENEVRHAAALLPSARFLMLDAPDVVRIRRLVTRQDRFDHIDQVSVAGCESNAVSLESIGIPELASLLGHAQQQELVQWVQSGQVSASELASKAHIILAERRNYDPIATRVALAESAGHRSLIVDTEHQTPDEIVQDTLAWLDRRS